tara:strand:+ start:177 stop:680 length:504 start_codon:yes stop_codon:yes gene_type:complete
MTEHDVIDNFLPKDYFDELKKIAMSGNIQWYWTKMINHNHKKGEDDLSSYFTHSLFNMHLDYIYSEHYKHFNQFWIYLKMKALNRMKLNLYPRTDTIEVHEPHIDTSFNHKGCIFSFNTCDGYTELEDGTKIQSVENRALLFNPSTLHSSTSTTNAKARLNININYF